MNIPEIPDLPPVNDVPPVNNVPDIPGVGPVNRADLPSTPGFDPYLSKMSTRAQLSVLKKTNGKFSRGDMDYWPNELARIRIPVEDRMELAQVFDAPYLADGAMVRVVGLWSRKKEPFRCWPVACPMTHYPYMLSHGHQRGVFIKPEWLERVSPGEQDKVFLSTCYKLSLDYEARLEQEAAAAPSESDPYAGLAPALAARMRRLAASASGAEPVAARTVDESALDILDAINKHKGVVEDMDMDMMLIVNDMNELYFALAHSEDDNWVHNEDGSVTHKGLNFTVPASATYSKMKEAFIYKETAAMQLKNADPWRYFVLCWRLRYPNEAKMMFGDLGVL